MLGRILNWCFAPAPTAAWFAAPALTGLAAFIVLTMVPALHGPAIELNDETKTSAQRVVVIAPSSAETICALGASDRIVGVSKFCVFPQQLLDKPRIGGLYDPDLERITALRPDLLVLRGRSEALMALAGQRGIAVYVDETDTLAGVVKAARDLGGLMQLEAEAAQVIARFEERLLKIATRTQGRMRPRVFVTVSRPTDRLGDLLTAGKNSFLTEMVHLAGGENIFADMDVAYPQVSLETVIARRPDVILELQPELELTIDTKRRMNEQWFSEGGPFPSRKPRLLIMTDRRALIPSLGYVEFIHEVSVKLHPEHSGE